MNLNREQRLWQKSYGLVVGLDESGRGCLAGPVVAAAVVLKNPEFEIRNPKQILNSKFQIPNKLKEVNDSKKLSEKKREKLYDILINHPAIVWGIGKVGPKVIDRINVLEATKLAMKRAIINLISRLPIADYQSLKLFLILDGKMKLELEIAQESIVGADGKIFSCAAASILSKVIRDRAMARYHKKYPQYGFAEHKGYATKRHREILKQDGPCKIHRMTFEPVMKSSKFKVQNSKPQLKIQNR
jgi:ribonuclease HII